MASDTNKGSVAYQREKQEFIDGLRHFHSTKGTPFGKLPWFGASEVDLYLLYQRVTSLGGWQKVNDEQRWDELFVEFSLPKGCLNGERALRHIYIRYLNLYEKVNFFGVDANQKDTQHEEEGPLRKKKCGPQYGVPLSYKYNQHVVPEERRQGAGLSTVFAKHSDYEKLEMALMSGLPNEVDFVINVCTLLSNESKHTLRLDRSTQLTDLLLAHVGVFHEGAKSLEKLYENGWRKSSYRDFIRFWFDNIQDPVARNLISYTREDQKKLMAGQETLHLARDLGVQDKEGIRITQLAIIIRNLSFDEDNMKYLANNDLIYRFLYLCIHCNYGTLRQLALDTIGNLAAQLALDPMNSWKSQTIINLLIKCLTSTDKFEVVRGLEMLCKLSQLAANEFALSENLDASIYEEIAKYLTIQDIQLIVSSLEALYQLSELGESTTSKIAEVSNTIDTLVSLITVEAQSYGPNSLVGIKVVEYCPPPHLTGGVTEGVPGAVGPPPTQAQPPGSQKMALPVVQTTTAKVPASQVVPTVPTLPQQPHMAPPAAPQAPQASPEMEASTRNWLQGTYESADMGMVSHIGLYSDYLEFCKKFNLTEALASQQFLTTIKSVFPQSSTVINMKDGGSKVLCIQGISKRPEPLPFSISAHVSKPRGSVATSSQNVLPLNTSVTRSPTLLQQLTAPLRPPTANPPIYPTGLAISQSLPQTPVQNPAGVQQQQTATSTQPTYSLGGSIPAQGYLTPDMGTTTIATTPTAANKKKNPPRKLVSKGKKQANILPRPELNPGNVPVVPKTPIVPNVQYTNIQPEVVYQTIDPNVRNLLAKKLRQGGSILIQPAHQFVGGQQVVMNVNDINSVADTSQLQYQTSSYPQNVQQQTTYIQYANPTQTNVQAVQTSQYQTQTFMVQPGNMLVQPNQQLPSSLPHHQIITQPIITQQQIVAQPHVMSQQQMVGQSHVIAPSPQIVTAQPIITQQAINQQFISAPTITNQQPLLVDTPISSLMVSEQEGASLLSQDSAHYSQPLSSMTSSPNRTTQHQNHSVCGDMEQEKASINKGIEETINKVENKYVQDDQNVDISLSKNSENQDVSAINEMNSAETDENASSPKLQGQSELDKSLEEEIESAVNSLMDDNICETEPEQLHENTGTVNENELNENIPMEEEDTEEPVMIENDGNELMFEPGYQQTIMNDVIDEANSAVENLEQFSTQEKETSETSFCDDPVKSALETSGIFDEGDEDELEDPCVLMNGVDPENTDIQTDQIPEKDQNIQNENASEALCDTSSVVQNEAVTEARVIEDQKAVAAPEEKSRPETPIIIPVIPENGLYEQDFEARMAVENLLKDVEFNVSGNDASSEENVAVYACPLQENPDSVRTTSSGSVGDNDMCEDSRDGISLREKTPESQVVTSNPSCLNHNGPVTSKSSSFQNNFCVTQNGTASVLMNGNLSSPDMSVPSPMYIPNGGDSKLVNGLEYDKSIVTKSVDKVSKLNGLVNHKQLPTNQVLEVYHSQVTTDTKVVKTEADNPGGIRVKEEVKSEERDILAQSILVNDIHPSDADFTYPEPTQAILPQVVKQYIPNQIIGNTMTVNCVQINNNSIPVVGSNCIMFTNNAILTSKVQLSSPITVCNSRHVPTPESSRDDLSCDSTTSSMGTSDISVIIPDKHSTGTQSKPNTKTTGRKSAVSPRPKSGDGKKLCEKKTKKRSRSKSGGSAADSRPSSTSSSTSAAAPMPEYMCEWAQCRRCFDNAKSLFPHVCSVHLKMDFSGICLWDGCEHLVRKRWSLFTHVQDHHCSEHSLRAAAHRRLQAFQSGQAAQNPKIPAMVYPNDAAVQAIKRFAPRPPYQEFLEGREGPVTKHIRLTSALILRNLARYSAAGRSLLKKHERVISYTCMSAVESSNALSSCLYEIMCITDSSC